MYAGLILLGVAAATVDPTNTHVTGSLTQQRIAGIFTCCFIGMVMLVGPAMLTVNVGVPDHQKGQGDHAPANLAGPKSGA